MSSEASARGAPDAPDAPDARDARFAWVLGLAAAGVLMATWAVAWIAYGTPLAFLRPADDAYYYYDLVRSVWHGMGLSTDGIHMTSGFHPLWFLVLLPFGALFRGPGDQLVVVAQLLGLVCLALAIVGMARAAFRLHLGRLAVAIAALSLMFAPWRNTASAGVEGALALALLCWFFAQMLVVTRDPSRRNVLVGGVLAGLGVLARLDAVFVIGSVLLFVLFGALRIQRLGRRGLRPTAYLLLPPIVFVGAYLFVNLVWTGHPFPITATLKSSFPTPHLSTAFVTYFKQYYVVVPIAWAGAVLHRGRPGAAAVWGLAAGSTAFALYLAAFGRGVFWWHFVSLVPAAAVGIGIVTDRILAAIPPGSMRRRTAGAVVTVAALVLVVPLVTSQFATYPNGDPAADSGWRVEALRAARWANRSLPADALIGMKDSGAFGFYTKQQVMNLDGVVSTRAFNDAICRGTTIDELRRSGVRYVAHHAVPADYATFHIVPYCWSAGRFATGFEVDRADEVYRGKPYWRDGDPDRVFVIWKFDPRAQPQSP